MQNIKIDIDKIRQDFGDLAKYCKKHDFTPNGFYALRTRRKFIIGSKTFYFVKQLAKDGYLLNLDELDENLRNLIKG